MAVVAVVVVCVCCVCDACVARVWCVWCGGKAGLVCVYGALVWVDAGVACVVGLLWRCVGGGLAVLLCGLAGWCVWLARGLAGLC